MKSTLTSRVVDALRQGPLTCRQISEKINAPYSSIAGILHRITKSGRLVHEGKMYSLASPLSVPVYDPVEDYLQKKNVVARCELALRAAQESLNRAIVELSTAKDALKASL